jgi:anaerobic magnesium-protoporphyrin IX monomethyl ester cyclase
MSERPVFLLEPPLFDCRAPHLGCAILTAALRSAGYRTIFRDLNVEAVLWLLEPERLEEGARAVAARRSGGERYLRAQRCGQGFGAMARDAVATLRHPERFYDPRAHHAARRTIDIALDLQALACHEQLYVSLCPQQYNGPYRATSMRDLLAASQDRESNLFLPFFERCVAPNVLGSAPLLVGVSISNVFQVIPGVTLARMLHAAGLYTVIGGPFFSKFAPQIAALPEFFDLCSAIAIGEGEQTLPALASAVAEKIAPARVPNLMYREGAHVVATGLQIPGELAEFGPADFRDLDLGRYLAPAPVLPIHAGKGCAWSRCTFCEIPQINLDFGRVRCTRQPRSVVAEMRIQGERHAARHFVFTDESLEPQLLRSVAAEIEAAGLDVNYLGYARFSKAFDGKLCEHLARSGCRKLLFGLESGSQIVNDRCRKGVDLKAVPEVIGACQMAGIAVHIFSIVGLPGEQAEEAAEGAEYLGALARDLHTPFSTMDVSPFYLNWNSRLRRNAREEGISYRAAQDFPLHADDYSMADGMDARTAAAAAGEIRERVCWEASALGFDIGYLNPLWPGWEEYTLLYLSRGAALRDHARRAWPVTTRDVLERTVGVAQRLGSRPAYGHKVLALSPSAEAVETPERLFRAIAGRRECKVGQLVSDSSSGAGSEEAEMEALVEVAQLIHAGVLEW